MEISQLQEREMVSILRGLVSKDPQVRRLMDDVRRELGQMSRIRELRKL